MSFRQKLLWTLTYVFVICGFGLVFFGVAMMPENLPAHALASWLHPGTLTAITGLITLGCAGVSLAMTGRE